MRWRDQSRKGLNSESSCRKRAYSHHTVRVRMHNLGLHEELTLTLRCLQLRQPLRDFLCDLRCVGRHGHREKECTWSTG